MPVSSISPFSGGFEYCAAENCDLELGVLSFAFDRLGVHPTHDSKVLSYSSVIADFTVDDYLLFAPSLDQDAQAARSLIIEVAQDYTIHSSNNLSILTHGPDNSNTIVTALTVTMLEELDYITIDNEETIYAPAGSLRVRISGFAPSGSSLSTGAIGLSFFLFAMEPTIVQYYAVEDGTYFTTYTYSSMYLKIPKYGTVDSTYQIIQSEVLQINQDMELLLTLPRVQNNFSLEFFICSNNVQYGNSSTSSSSAERLLIMGDTNGPTKNMKGEDVPTKLLVLPRGQFGLCFDTLCSTSAIKLEFSGLASSEGIRYNRFANAAAFSFSPPQHYQYSTYEAWSTTFRVYTPQSRVRPPLWSELEKLSPQFSVNIDQYLAPGRASYSVKSLQVPRGALKFTFFIYNWKFTSDTEMLTMNMTLSSIVGPIPGSTKFSVVYSHDLMRLSFDTDNFVDIPLLAIFDDQVSRISVTPVFESGIGIVLMMTFGKFTNLAYDPIVASEPLVAMDARLGRTPVKYTIIEASGIILAAILGLMIAVSVVRFARKMPVKIDFSKVVL